MSRRRRRRSKGYLVSFGLGFILGAALVAAASVQTGVFNPWVDFGLPVAFGLFFLAAQWGRNTMFGY